MLAAMYYAPMDIRLEERPVPQPGPGEALLQVAAATTCGTDVKSYRRGHPLLFQHTPAGFGHEVSGVVAATGSGVTRCVEGDAVVVANSAPCLQCYYCQRQRYSLCERLLFLNGAYAEYLLIPQPIVSQNLYKLAPSTSFIAAALTEPVACALHGVDACSIMPGDTVIILGSGPLGLLLTALARLQGARVVMTGHGAERLALAHSYGAHTIMDVSGFSLEDQRDNLLAETKGRRGADIVIEHVGSAVWQQALKCLGKNGRVVTCGATTGFEARTDLRYVWVRELTILGSDGWTREELEALAGRGQPFARGLPELSAPPPPRGRQTAPTGASPSRAPRKPHSWRASAARPPCRRRSR